MAHWGWGGFLNRDSPSPRPTLHPSSAPPAPHMEAAWAMTMPSPGPALGMLPALLKEVPPLVFLETAWRDLLICAPTLSFSGENPRMHMLNHLL